MPTTFRDHPASAPTDEARSRARSLRRDATPAERKLWWHLRHRLPQERTHFRGQVPLGRYVADFCCLNAKLVVEVDGDQHGFEAARVKDAERTAELARQGFRVLRFSNREVMTSVDVVLDTILAASAESPPPGSAFSRVRPPHRGEGGCASE